MYRIFGLGAFAIMLAFMSVMIDMKTALASSGGGEEEAVVEEGPFYLEMKPLSVPIRRKSGAIKYYMFIAMSMEFDEKEKKDYSRRMLPRVRDAFIQDLSGRSVLHKDKKMGVDFELVKRRLVKQAEKVLGKNAPNGMHVVKVFKGS